MGDFIRHRPTTLRARRQRQESTVAESALWEILRGHRLENWGFRRQSGIAGYVADFVCHDPKLVVEVDGPIHDRAEKAAFDKKRDAEMEALGYAVLRLDERMVREQPGLARACIKMAGQRVLQGLPPIPEIEA